MAHLRTLERLCGVQDCDRKATVELLGRGNDLMGAYCMTHGRAKLRDCEQHEQREDKQREDKQSIVDADFAKAE